MLNLRSQLNYYSRNECLDSNREEVHCTAKFCQRNEAESNAAYAQRPQVQEALGQFYQLAVIGFVIAKDTFGEKME